jgi:hypothetical protein
MAAWIVLVLVLDWCGVAGSCRCVCPVVGSQHQKMSDFHGIYAFVPPLEDEDEDDMPQPPLLAPLLCKPGHSRRKLFLCTYATSK